MPGDATQPEARSMLLKTLLYSLGAGGVLGGVVSAGRAMTPPPQPSETPGPLVIRTPPDRRKKPAPSWAKAGSGYSILDRLAHIWDHASSTIGSAADSAASHVGSFGRRVLRATTGTPDYDHSWADYLGGRTITSPWAKPYVLPAAAGLVTLGTVGGYKGVNHIADKLTGRSREEEEVEKAKRMYIKAIAEQSKSAAADDIGSDLDKLYEMCKQATDPSPVHSGLGGALGAYLAAIGLGTGISGYAAYKATRADNPSKVLAKALKDQERIRWLTRPPELTAITDTDPAARNLKTAAREEVLNKAAQLAAMYKA